MLNGSNYLAPVQHPWQGRTDIPAHSCIYQAIQLLDLTQPLPTTPHPLAFAILGFRCDEGIRRNQGRTGAKEGPEQLRPVLAKMPLPRADITCYDAGDIICHDEALEPAQTALGEAVALLLQHHIIPIIIGGGHELAWGHFQGLMQTKKPISIVNFDAHFDMRPLLDGTQATSGTPFLQIADACEKNHIPFHYHCIGIQKSGNISALFATAKKYHVKTCYADELQLQPTTGDHYIDEVLLEKSSIYTSICLDVFAAPYAPGVSAPQPLGVTPWHIIPLLRRLAASKKVISYDIAELSPRYDIDGRTIKLAANLVFEILAHHVK